MVNYLRFRQADECFISPQLSCEPTPACVLTNCRLEVRKAPIVNAYVVSTSEMICTVILARAFLAFRSLSYACFLVAEVSDIAVRMDLASLDLHQASLLSASSWLVLHEVLLKEWRTILLTEIAQALTVILAWGAGQSLGLGYQAIKPTSIDLKVAYFTARACLQVYSEGVFEVLLITEDLLLKHPAQSRVPVFR